MFIINKIKTSKWLVWLCLLITLVGAQVADAAVAPVSFIKAMKACKGWDNYQKNLFTETKDFVHQAELKKGGSDPIELSQKQYLLAMLYAYGIGTERNFNIAFTHLEKAAKYSENYSAQEALARFYRQGRGVKRDYRKSRVWQKTADDTRAARVLKHLGTETPPIQVLVADYKKAFKICKKQAKKGNQNAQIYLGRLYTYALGTMEDKKAAIKWFKKAADSGNVPAMVNLGRAYLRSKNLFVNVQELAAKWYQKAANKNYAPGQFFLARVYFTGVGVPQNLKAAFKWYMKAAKQGYQPAQIELAKLYLKGLGTKKDAGKAVKWLKRAAERGSSQAMLELGTLYYEGEYVGKDYTQARQWLEKASKRRNGEALYGLGMMYFDGTGIKQDYKKAYQILLQAAHNGSERAKNSLGIMYYQGLSVKKNNIVSFAFFNSGGFAKKASEVKKSMTEAEVKTARKLSLIYMRKFNGWKIKGIDHIGQTPLPSGVRKPAPAVPNKPLP